MGAAVAVVVVFAAFAACWTGSDRRRRISTPQIRASKREAHEIYQLALPQLKVLPLSHPPNAFNQPLVLARYSTS